MRQLLEHELPDRASMREVAVELLMKTVGDHDICAQELWGLISGEALYTLSRSFVLLTVPALLSTLKVTCGDLTRFPINRFSPYLLYCTGGPVEVLASRRRRPVVVRVFPFLSSARDGSRFEEYCYQLNNKAYWEARFCREHPFHFFRSFGPTFHNTA